MLPGKNISFEFMKYIRPIWYFHLKPYDGKNTVWVEYEQLSMQEKELILYDQEYSNQALSNWDASYQALMKGIVKQVRNNSQTKEIKLLPIDIYRFVRKYHKKIWLYSTFIQRLFSFSNPINELIGFWQTRQVKNINLFQEDFYLLIYLFFIILLSFLLFRTNYNFSSFFLALASSISNIGFATELSQNNISFFFLILTIVGGSFFSTSSGIRFVKLYSLFKFSINELISHVKPKNVYITKLKFSNSKFEVSEVNKFFLSVIVFIISLLVLSSILSFTHINFENSFKLAILTLMNTVNSEIHGLKGFNFQELQYYTKYFLIFFMIIGRVELLTLLIIIKKFFFKN